MIFYFFINCFTHFWFWKIVLKIELLVQWWKWILHRLYWDWRILGAPDISKRLEICENFIFSKEWSQFFAIRLLNITQVVFTQVIFYGLLYTFDVLISDCNFRLFFCNLDNRPIQVIYEWFSVLDRRVVWCFLNESPV